MTTKGTRRQAADQAAGRRRVAIYVRISQDRANEVSTAVQENDGRGYAALKDWDVVEVYSDIGLSASKPNVVRPAYLRMLADVEAGLIDVVLIWKLDRLGRSVIELNEVAKSLRARKVDLVSVHDVIDTSTPGGRFMFTVLAALAELESDQIALRVTAANDHRAHVARLPHGGSRTYGYEVGGTVIVDAEAERIREAADRIEAGECRSAIATDWNRRGVPTASGTGKWWPANLTRALTNPQVAGFRSYHGTLIAGDWPAIITPQRRTDLMALFADPKAPTRTNKVNLLGGLLHCALCGRRMHFNPRNGHGGPRYGCAPSDFTGGCGKVHVAAAPVEAHLRQIAFDALVDDAFRSALRSGRSYADVERIQAEMVAVQEDLDYLAQRFGQRKISASEWEIAREPFQETLDTLGTELEGMQMALTPGDAPDVPDNYEDLEAWWAAAEVKHRRALLHSVVERVEVGRPARPGPYNRERILPPAGLVKMRA